MTAPRRKVEVIAGEPVTVQPDAKKAAREILVHWRRVRASKLSAEEARENLRCAADLADAFGWQADRFWRDGSEGLPHRAEHHSSGSIAREMAVKYMGISAELFAGDDEPRRGPGAELRRLVCRLTDHRFDWSGHPHCKRCGSDDYWPARGTLGRWIERLCWRLRESWRHNRLRRCEDCGRRWGRHAEDCPPF